MNATAKANRNWSRPSPFRFRLLGMMLGIDKKMREIRWPLTMGRRVSIDAEYV